jgi:hypothetical protein
MDCPSGKKSPNLDQIYDFDLQRRRCKFLKRHG